MRALRAATALPALVAVAATVGVVLALLGAGPAPGTGSAPVPTARTIDPPAAPLPSGGGRADVGPTRVEAAVLPPAGSRPAQLRLALTRIRDGAPVDVAGLRARVEPAPGAGADPGCGELPPVQGLDGYHLLTLDRPGSVSALDPGAPDGGVTHLYARTPLPGPAADWALDRATDRLFVSIPSRGVVAVVDVREHRLVAEVPVAAGPGELLLDAARGRLWVASAADAGGTVSLIDTTALRTVHRRRLPAAPLALLLPGETGDPHDLGHADQQSGPAPALGPATPGPAVAPPLVVVQRDGVVRVVDRDDLADLAVRRTGGPVADATALRDPSRLLVAPAEGPPLLLATADLRELGRAPGATGTTRLAVAPDGGAVLALRGPAGEVSVLDPLDARVRASARVGGRPEHVAFSGGAAYVWSPGTGMLAVLAAAELRQGPLRPALVPVGATDRDRGQAAAPGGSLLAPVHGGVLVASPGGGSVSMYMPGMNAPMSGLSTAGQQVQAVLVLDRGLRRERTGLLAGPLELPRPGAYRLVVLLPDASPTCFPLEAARPEGEAALPVPVAVQLLPADPPLTPGRPGVLHLRLTSADGAGVSGLADLQVLAQRDGGGDDRAVAVPQADGTYRVELLLPAAGDYALLVAVPSRQVSLGSLPRPTLHVPPGASPPSGR